MNGNLKKLIKQLSEEIEANKEALSSGSAKDYPDYRGTCGVIQGLSIALREVLTLAKKYEEDDDDTY